MRRKQLDIPGFSRYIVKPDPVCVVDAVSGVEVKRHKRRRGHDTIHLYDDSNKRRSLSIVTVLALAFHGQSPHGYVAHCYGEFTPASVQWIPRYTAQGMRVGLSADTRCRAYELYFEDGLTQTEIAKRLGCSQTAVSRAISRNYSNHASRQLDHLFDS